MPDSLELSNQIYNIELRLKRLYNQLEGTFYDTRYVRAVQNLITLQSRQISILTSLIEELEEEQAPPPLERYYAEHIIQVGETLRVLALEYDTSVSAIKRFNPGLSDNPAAGTIVTLPIEIPRPPANSIRYYVRRGDTLFEIAKLYNTDINTLVRMNSINDPDVIFPGRILVIPNYS